MPGRRRQQGRICTYQQDTCDIVDLLGDDVAIATEHQALVRNTEKLEINIKLLNEYRNRISHICKFLEVKYPEYYQVGVGMLFPEEKVSIDHHWNKHDHDLIYSDLNIKFVKAFLDLAKKKKNGKICSNFHRRRYKDAIL